MISQGKAQLFLVLQAEKNSPMDPLTMGTIQVLCLHHGLRISEILYEAFLR